MTSDHFIDVDGEWLSSGWPASLRIIVVDTSLVSSLAKILASVVTASLGVAGVVVSYHRPDGSINRWGKVVIGGITLSAAIGAGVTMLDAYASQESSKKQEVANGKLLEDIDRTLNPLGPITLYYQFEAPSGGPAFGQYEDAIRREIDTPRFRNDANPLRTSHGTAVAKLAFLHRYKLNPSVVGEDGRVQLLDIQPESSVLPRRFRKLSEQLSSLTSEIAIYRSPVKTTEYPIIIGATPNGPNLIGNSSFLDLRKQIGFDFGDNAIKIGGLDKVDFVLGFSDGRISSTLDLVGAEMQFQPKAGGLLDCRFDGGGTLGDFRLETFSLDFGGGRKIWIRPAAFQKAIHKDGCPTFTYVFPATVDSFNALLRESPEDAPPTRKKLGGTPPSGLTRRQADLPNIR